MSSSIQKKPKVSVCIVTFNHAKYIRDCLLSVLMQRHDADLEILVGDDRSTDNTSSIVRQIADEYPGLIKFFCHEKKLGPSGNIKFVIQQANGDYIAHLDGDDFWLPGKLEHQLQFLNKQQTCIAVYTNAVVVNKENVLLGVFNNIQPEIQDINYLLRRGNYLNHSSLFYRSKAKNNILSIKGDLLDYRIHCCLALLGDLGYLNSALVAYRSGAEGSLVSTTPDVVRKMLWDALKEMDKSKTGTEALIEGMCHLVGHIYFDCFLRLRFSHALQWTMQIRRDMPAHFYRIAVFGIAACIANAAKAVLGKLSALLFKNPLRIIHYR
jgi:glycosyltransferase involved in cell wall biosynthesis